MCPPLYQIVEQVLWKEYPPHPPDEDELEAEADLAANKEAGKAKEKEKQKAARAAAKRAALGGDEGGDDMEGAESRDGPPPDLPAPKRKAAARQPKAYVPLAGTSAYAFLILMYQVRGVMNLTLGPSLCCCCYSACVTPWLIQVPGAPDSDTHQCHRWHRLDSDS